MELSSTTGTTTSPSSAVNMKSVSAKDQLAANKSTKNTVTEKKATYPTQATGADPKERVAGPFDVSADYYRFGKYREDNKGYEVTPRYFEPYEERVPSSIRIYGKEKGKSTFKDFIPAYTKFILENVQESHTERSQIVETFGDFYVFMFGERPPIYNFSGQLINAKNASWVTDFSFMYDRYLRGTKCVEMNATAYITYGGRQIEGLILSTASSTNAITDGGVPFNFSVVVFEKKFFNFSSDMGFSTSDFKNLWIDTDFRKLLEQIAGTEGTGSSDPAYSKAAIEGRRTANGKPSAGTVKNIVTGG